MSEKSKVCVDATNREEMYMVLYSDGFVAMNDSTHGTCSECVYKKFCDGQGEGKNCMGCKCTQRLLKRGSWYE